MSEAFRVRADRCDSCLYRLRYPRRTRDRVLGDAAANDGYVSCHKHSQEHPVCCNGYWHQVGEQGCTVVQIAIRLDRAGLVPVEWVTDGMYPPEPEEDEEPDEENEQ